MDKEGQSEVTSKLRSAIKKKLSEISDFVDDELPEYIMILVANQRSKSQIEKDLCLFLRDDTINFTNWLWDLLNNINTGSKSIHSSLPKNDSNLSKQKDVEIDEDAIVLDCDPDEKENDLLSHNGDTSDSNLSMPSVPHSSSHAYDDIMKEASKLNSRGHIAADKNKKEERSPGKKIHKKYPQQSKETLSSKVVSVKKRLIDSDDEYDPTKPEYMSKSNITTPRNYGGPAALQRNKLLLKAVDDATKSILDGKNIEEYYKPTPIKVLTSKRFQSNYQPKKDDLSLKTKKVDYDFASQLDFNSDVSQNSGFHELEYSNVCIEDNSLESPVTMQKSRTICLRNIPLIPDNVECESANCTTRSSPEYSFPAVEEVRPKSPHFIVTLEGVNLPSFKRKLEDNSVDSMEEDEDNVLSDEYDEDSPSSKKIKVNERCKYWPACKNSDYCSYHHPAVPCKSFPDCKFGDKCLYIHPNCKFDALCSRKDCPFTHASKRKLPLTTLPVRMFPIQNRKVKIVCKFYPKCTATNCPFIHPKLCRYGTKCQLPVCVYSHFPLPSRSQLKWQASVS